MLVAAGFVPRASAQPRDALADWATRLPYEHSIHPDIVYARAGGQEIKLDVIRARLDPAPRPTVILIHGGGWVANSKDTSTLGALPYLTLRMNVVIVGYRLADSGLAPAAVEDCRCALKWVYRNAKEYAFDTNRLVVVGGSAGGHLALMTGMLTPDAGFDNVKCNWWPPQRQDFKVAAIVNFFGITDVADLLEGPHRQDFAVAWMGNPPNRADLARRLSPLTYVRPELPPVLTVHGDMDPSVPYEHGVRLHRELDRVGVANQLVTIKGGKHGFQNVDQALIGGRAVNEFLRTHRILDADVNRR